MATQPSPLISRQGPPLKYRPKLAPGSNQSAPALSSNLRVGQDPSQDPSLGAPAYPDRGSQPDPTSGARTIGQLDNAPQLGRSNGSQMPAPQDQSSPPPPQQSTPNQPVSLGQSGGSAPSTPVSAPPSVNTGNNPYSAESFNPFNSRDVYNQNQQMGQDQFQQGQDWKNNYGQLGDYYNQQEATAGANYNAQLGQFAAGNGGFTQDQQNNIVQSGAYGAVQGDQQNNFLTPSEQSGIQGNPYAAKDLFSGQAQGLTDIAAGENANLQNAANTGAAQGDNVVNQFGQTVNSSINPANLQLSAGYKPGVDNALQLGQSQLTSAQNNPALTPTASYLKQAGMSDQEVQDTSEAAARSVGAQYGATKDELIQNARASGEGSPLAIASAESGLDRSSAADQSDALTQARLGARQQQINAATGVQNTQLNAGQYQAGLGSQNALAEQNANISANTTAEQLRLAANSNLTNTQLQGGQTLASLGLQNNSTNTQNQMNAFQTGAQAGLSTGEYNATTATNLTQQAEANAQARAAQVATNRQGVNQSNETANTNIAGQLSNQYQAAYAPGVQGKQLALTGQGNQQQYYGGQANAQGQLALGGWQTANQGQQNAAGNYANWGENQQSTAGVTGAINNIATVAKAVTGGKAKGGLITQHQTIEVGEQDRPEAILPLDPATPPEKRNTWEKLGVQLGHRLGIHSNPDSFIGHSDHLPKLPKTHFATGGLISFDPSNPFTTDERDLSRAEDPFASVGGNGYARGGVVGGIKPSHAGMLHENMGIPLGQKIPLSSLEAEKRKAMASGNPAIVKRATFAENARHWAH